MPQAEQRETLQTTLAFRQVLFSPSGNSQKKKEEMFCQLRIRASGMLARKVEQKSGVSVGVPRGRGFHHDF